MERKKSKIKICQATFQVYLQYIDAWYIELISDSNSNMSETSFATICCCVESGDHEYCILFFKYFDHFGVSQFITAASF